MGPPSTGAAPARALPRESRHGRPITARQTSLRHLPPMRGSARQPLDDPRGAKRVPLPAPLRWRSPLGHVGMHRNFSIEFRRAAFQEVMQINHAGCREIQRLRQRRNGVEQFKCLSSEHPLNPFRVSSCIRNDLIFLALSNFTARIIL
jgi:hypothetical protein